MDTEVLLPRCAGAALRSVEFAVCPRVRSLGGKYCIKVEGIFARTIWLSAIYSQESLVSYWNLPATL